MAQQATYVTFRVSRIPPDVTAISLVAVVQDCFAVTETTVGVYVRSLTPSANDWDVSELQTATIEFYQLPPLLQDATRNEWTLLAQSYGYQLTLDRHFLGLTQLNTLPKNKHEVDCIAISGLAGHPFGSWRQRDGLPGSPQFMWLRDQLPLSFPNLRVLTYGYNTDLLLSESVQNVDDLARSFILHLKSVDKSGSSSKPLVLLAHSLGGVIVKRAMLYLAVSNEAETHILNRIRMVIFFGVPNRGMYIKHLRAMVQGQPNEQLIRDLSVDSPYLQIIDDAFSGIVKERQIRIVSAFETRRSRTAELQSTGKWERRGPPELLVTRDSAIHRGSKDPQDVIPVDQDHSDIVKFAPNDITYSIVRNFVREMLTSLSGGFISPVPNRAILEEQERGGWQKNVSPESTFRLLSLEVPSIKSRTFATLSKDEQNHLRAFWDMKASLTFAEQDLRLQAIEDAHGATLGWIFEKQDLGFLEWVMDGSGTYWIRGKPGSGKSTVMKYLHQNRDFRSTLLRGTHYVRRHDLWFFFNERGAFIQKTTNGLLRTILYQLVHSDLYLASIVFDIWLSRVPDPIPIKYEWSQDDLDRCFEAVLGQSAHDIDLLLFLDALDEYRGFPQVIARWLKTLSETSQPNSTSRTKVKVCFASREWDAFVAAFDETSSGFRLHEHTFDDIQQYVMSRATILFSDQVKDTIQSEATTTPLTIDLIARLISKKAEGVFLWAKLAIDELDSKAALPTNADAMKELVNRIPVQLEKFYKTIINRIPRHTRQRAFTLLEIVLRSSRLLTVSDLFFAAECSVADTYEECLAILEASRNEQDVSRLPVELHNLCAGLLECEQSSRSRHAPRTSNGPVYVQFIHKTVKDFVGSLEFPQLFLGDDHGLRSENGHTWLMKYYLALKDKRLRTTIWHCAYHSERTLGLPATSFLNSVSDSVFKELYADLLVPHPLIDRFVFATLANLQLYVAATLADRSRYVLIRRSQAKPFHAIASLWGTDELGNAASSPEVLDKPDVAQMFRLLLSLGFKVDEEYNGATPWDLLFKHGSDWSKPNISPDMIRLAQIMIEIGGQDPSLRLADFDNPDTPTRGFRTALHVSVSSPEMVSLLLRNQANPNMLNSRKCTPLDLCVGGTLGSLNHLTNTDYAVMMEVASALITHGGCISARRDQYSLQVFLDRIEGYARSNGLKVPEEFQFQNIPRLYFLPPEPAQKQEQSKGASKIGAFFSKRLSLRAR